MYVCVYICVHIYVYVSTWPWQRAGFSRQFSVVDDFQEGCRQPKSAGLRWLSSQPTHGNHTCQLMACNLRCINASAKNLLHLVGVSVVPLGYPGKACRADGCSYGAFRCRIGGLPLPFSPDLRRRWPCRELSMSLTGPRGDRAEQCRQPYTSHPPTPK